MCPLLPTGRTRFREPIPEISLAAATLDQAASAHVTGNRALARDLIRQADLPILREWLESIWGKASPHIHPRIVPGAPPLRPLRTAQRMPTVGQKRALIERDGHHCRLCGMPVIRAEVRRYLRRDYGDVLPWGTSNATQHAAFQLFWLQYDHRVPHARGGNNEPDNLFVACAACNFGRMNWTLEEVGFLPLEDIHPTRSDWDGIERVLPATQRISWLGQGTATTD